MARRDRKRPSRPPARVMLLLEALDNGGTQRQAIELARHLNPERFRVEIGLLAPADDMVFLAEAQSIPLTWVARRKPLGPAGLLQLWRHLRSSAIDILLLLTVIPNIWGRVFGRLAGIPVVIGTCRGGGSPRRQHDWLLWPLADHHVCNTRQLGERLVRRHRIPASRLSVIPNGVDTSFFSPPRPAAAAGGTIILAVARLVPDKDHETLIAAFQRVLRRHPEARLCLVGNGPRRVAISRSITEKGLGDKIRMLPGQGDPRPYYWSAGMLVLSSRREGSPNVVLEAMACALPVVATRVGGVPDLVEQERSGLLVNPGDPAALAEAIGRLLADEGLRRRYGQAGRERAVASYALSAMARQYDALFSRLLGWGA